MSDKEYKFAYDLTPANIAKYVYLGDKLDNKKMEEFINVCRVRKVDPFLKEIYLQGYGQNVNFYIGKDGTLLRARRIPDYAGYKLGYFLEDGSRWDDPVAVGGNKIMGAYCNVYIKGFDVPLNASCLLSEYIKKTRDGVPNRQWAEMGAVMIAKCAIVSAHRNAFPEAFGGLYEASEMTKVPGHGDSAEEEAAAPVITRKSITDKGQTRYADKIEKAVKIDDLDKVFQEMMHLTSDMSALESNPEVMELLSANGVKNTGYNFPPEITNFLVKTYNAQFQRIQKSMTHAQILKGFIDTDDIDGVKKVFGRVAGDIFTPDAQMKMSEKLKKFLTDHKVSDAEQTQLFPFLNDLTQAVVRTAANKATETEGA